MLGKLIKHEFKGTYKIFGVLFGSLILLTLLSRFCLYVPFENVVYDMISGLLNIVYVLSIVCISVVSIVIVMLRYNRTMYKDEGYLTHTLPVKPWKYIVSKTITYVVWIMSSIIMMFVSLFIYFVGTKEFDKVIDFFNDVIKVVKNQPQIIVTGIIVLIVCIVQLIVNIISYMSALALGQMFRKHKIFGAVLFYLALNSFMSAVSTWIMAIIPNFMDYVNGMTKRFEKVSTIEELVNIGCNTMNVMMLVSTVILIITGAVYFMITNYMLSKKIELD